MARILDREFFDLDDLFDTPDDGNRYEVLDGALVVTPPPGTAHQGALVELLVLVRQAAMTRGLRTFVAPVAWHIGPGQVPEPDLMVVERSSITPRSIEGQPVLVVEVLSPTGRRRDLSEKRRIYADGGAPTYWVVDPAEPSLTVLRLSGSEYHQEARVIGSEAYATDDPFPIRVVPDDLVAEADNPPGRGG